MIVPSGASRNPAGCRMSRPACWPTNAPVAAATAFASALWPSLKARPCLAASAAVVASSSTENAATLTPSSASPALDAWREASWSLQNGHQCPRWITTTPNAPARSCGNWIAPPPTAGTLSVGKTWPLASIGRLLVGRGIDAAKVFVSNWTVKSNRGKTRNGPKTHQKPATSDEPWRRDARPDRRDRRRAGLRRGGGTAEPRRRDGGERHEQVAALPLLRQQGGAGARSDHAADAARAGGERGAPRQARFLRRAAPLARCDGRSGPGGWPVRRLPAGLARQRTRQHLGPGARGAQGRLRRLGRANRGGFARDAGGRDAETVGRSRDARARAAWGDPGRVAAREIAPRREALRGRVRHGAGARRTPRGVRAVPALSACVPLVDKTANVLNKLPKSRHTKAKRALQEFRVTETNAAAQAAFDAFGRGGMLFRDLPLLPI